MTIKNKENKIVADFCGLMYKKIELRHNRYAPLGWKTMDMKRLITLLEGEMAELKEAYGAKDKKGMRDEAVDVANYAMFIHELQK